MSEQVLNDPQHPQGFPDVYSVGEYGFSPNAGLTDNWAALQHAINDAFLGGYPIGQFPYQSGSGYGTIYIPFFTGDNIQLTGTIIMGDANADTICPVRVVGNRAQRIQLQSDQDFFFVSVPGGGSGPGLYAGTEFARLTVYGQSGFSTGTAFRFAHVSGNGAANECMVSRCFVANMGGGISFENTLGAHAFFNTVYENNAHANYGYYVGSNGSSAAANQTYMVGNLWLGKGSGSTAAGYRITGCDGVRVCVGSSQSSQNAFLIGPDGGTANVFKVTITDVDAIAVNDAILYTTTPGGQWIAGVVASHINIQGGKSGTGSGVRVSLGASYGAGGGATQIPNTQISGLNWVACDSWNASDSGYRFDTGAQLRIIGGQASSNSVAGLRISGPVADLLAIGLDLSTNYQLGHTTTTQPLALLIDNALGAGTAGSIRLAHCAMRGYSGVPISVTAAPLNLRLYDCPGYTDQKTAIPTTNLVTGTSAAAAGYYGAYSRYEWTGNTGSITVNAGISHTEAAGSLWLDAYDVLKTTVAPTAQSWIGYG